MVRETSRLSERWNCSGSSPWSSATSHFRLVQAALLTETYTACQRCMTYVAVLCGGS